MTSNAHKTEQTAGRVAVNVGLPPGALMIVTGVKVVRALQMVMDKLCQPVFVHSFRALFCATLSNP